MNITIRSDSGINVTVNIDVKEMMYCGNGSEGKFIWMGEEGYSKAVVIGMSKAELSTLKRTYDLSELEVTQEVKE